MMEAIAKDIIKAPGFFEDPRVFRAWTKCSWSGSSPGSIDPLKEIMASDRRVKLGVSTLERECLEINGSDWRANTIQQGIELNFSDENGLPYTRNQTVTDEPILLDEEGNLIPPTSPPPSPNTNKTTKSKIRK
jgi:capsid protein